MEQKYYLTEKAGYICVNDVVTDCILLRLKYEDGMYRRLTSDVLTHYLIPRFIEYDAKYYLDDHFDKYALALTQELSLDIKCVAFCVFHNIGCVDGARLCSVSAPTFRKRVKKFNKYVEYTKFWYENRDILDLVIKVIIEQRRSLWQKKFNIFTDLLHNPFLKTSDLAAKYGIKPSTVRSHLKECCAALIGIQTCDEDFNVIAAMLEDQLLKPFMEIVFGQLKKVKRIKRKLSSEVFRHWVELNTPYPKKDED